LKNEATELIDNKGSDLGKDRNEATVLVGEGELEVEFVEQADVTAPCPQKVKKTTENGVSSRLDLLEGVRSCHQCQAVNWSQRALT
jgi:hypothetical protein